MLQGRAVVGDHVVPEVDLAEAHDQPIERSQQGPVVGKLIDRFVANRLELALNFTLEFAILAGEQRQLRDDGFVRVRPLDAILSSLLLISLAVVALALIEPSLVVAGLLICASAVVALALIFSVAFLALSLLRASTVLAVARFSPIARGDLGLPFGRFSGDACLHTAAIEGYDDRYQARDE